MKELVEKIAVEYAEFAKNAEAQVVKGNKAAGARARKAALALMKELKEAAQIDGANEFVVLLRIILPLSMPVVAVMLLFYGVGHWNNWFSAVVYIRHRSKYPLQLILREILIENEVSSMTTDVGSLDKEAISETIKSI